MQLKYKLSPKQREALSLRIKVKRQHMQTKKDVKVDIRPQANKNLADLKNRLRTHHGLRPEMKERVEQEKQASFPDISPDKIVLTERERKLIAKLASQPFVLMHGTQYIRAIKQTNALLSVRERKRRGINKPISHTHIDTGNDDTVFFAYKEVPHYIKAKDQIAVDLSAIIEKDSIQATQFWSSDVFYCHKAGTTLPPIQLGNTTLQIKYRKEDDKHHKIFEYRLPNGQVDTEVIARGEEISFGANIPVFRFYRIIEQLRKLDSEYREYILNNIDNDEIIDTMVRAITLVRGYELHKTAQQSLNNEFVRVIDRQSRKTVDDEFHKYYRRKWKKNGEYQYVDIEEVNLLIKAILDRDTKKVVSLLKEGADINHRTAREVNPLFAGVLSEDPKIMRILLEHSRKNRKNNVSYPANPFVSPTSIPRAVEIAMCRKDVQIAAMLLQVGAYHVEKDLNAALKDMSWYRLEKRGPAVLLNMYYSSKHYPNHASNIPTEYANHFLQEFATRDDFSNLECLYSTLYLYKFRPDIKIKYQNNRTIKSLEYLKSVNKIGTQLLLDYIDILDKLLPTISESTSENVLKTIFNLSIEQLADYKDSGPLKEILNFLIIKSIESNDYTFLQSCLVTMKNDFTDEEINNCLGDFNITLKNEKITNLWKGLHSGLKTLPASVKNNLYVSALKQQPFLMKSSDTLNLSEVSEGEFSKTIEELFFSAMDEKIIIGKSNKLLHLIQLAKNSNQLEKVRHIILTQSLASYKAAYPDVDVEKYLFQDYLVAKQYQFILGEEPNLENRYLDDPSIIIPEELIAKLNVGIYNNDMIPVRICFERIEKLPEKDKKYLYEKTFFSLSPEASFLLFKMGFTFMFEQFSFELKEFVLSQACEYIGKNDSIMVPGIFESLSPELLLSFQEKMITKLPRTLQDQISKGAKLLGLKNQLSIFIHDENEITRIITKLMKITNETDLFAIFQAEKSKVSPFIQNLRKRWLGWTPEQLELFNSLKRSGKILDSTNLKKSDFEEMHRMCSTFGLNPSQAYDYFQISRQEDNHDKIMFQLQPSSRTYLKTYSNLSIALSVIFLNIFLLVIVPIVFNVAIANEKKKLESNRDSWKKGLNPYAHPDFKTDPDAGVSKDASTVTVADVVIQQPVQSTVTLVAEKVVDHSLVLGF